MKVSDYDMEFHAEARSYMQTIDLYGKCGNSYLRNFIMETPENDIVRQPPIEISKITAQNLIDALYRAGIRPSQLVKENVSDIKYHLEDMRRIVFKGKG